MIKRLLSILVFLGWSVGCKPAAVAPTRSPGTMRIASTAPSLTEMVCAIGAGMMLVGRSEVCDYPPAVTNLPVIGGFGTPRAEAVAAVAPTHVLVTDWIDRSALDALTRRGIVPVKVPCARLREIPAACRQLGELTGQSTAAQALAEKIEQGMAAAGRGRRLSETPPRVLVLLSLDRPITVGRDTFITDLLELAGCQNVAAELTRSYSAFSMEWLVKANPDRILCLFMHAEKQDVAAILSTRLGWSSLRAVRNGAIDVPSDYNLLVRPGPRVLEGLRELRALTHRVGRKVK